MYNRQLLRGNLITIEKGRLERVAYFFSKLKSKFYLLFGKLSAIYLLVNAHVYKTIVIMTKI